MARLSFPLEDIFDGPADPICQSMAHARFDLEQEILEACNGGLRGRMLRNAITMPGAGILDVGTGTGKWATCMAREFPSSKIVGMDITATPFSEPPPPNCQFINDDPNKGLRHYGWSFHLVHLRASGGNIDNWNDLLEDIYGVLRPGGLLVIVEANSQIVGRDGHPVQAVDEKKPGFSWVAGYMRTAEVASTGPQIFQGLAPNMVLQSLPHLESQLQWHKKGTREVMIQLGGPKDILAEHSDRIKDDISQLCSSYRPLLALNGLSESTIDAWIQKVEQELRGSGVRTYVKWTIVWAQKSPVDSVA